MQIRVVHVLIAVTVLLILSMFLMAFYGPAGSNTIYWLLSVSALNSVVVAIILYSKKQKK